MAKARYEVHSLKISPIATEAELEPLIKSAFAAAGFRFVSGSSLPPGAEFVMQRTGLGRDLNIAVDLMAHANARAMYDHARRAKSILNGAPPSLPLDEYWIIYTQGDYNLIGYKFPQDRRIRILSLEELPKTLALPRGRKPRPIARTKIGKALAANEKQIVLAIEALRLQIEDKIARLRDERPNDPDAVKRVNSSIAEFAEMQAELERIRVAVQQFTKSKRRLFGPSLRSGTRSVNGGLRTMSESIQALPTARSSLEPQGSSMLSAPTVQPLLLLWAAS
jgi:hypothetical protein